MKEINIEKLQSLIDDTSYEIINWNYMVTNYYLPEDLLNAIIKNTSKGLDLIKSILQHQKLSQDFIKKYINDSNYSYKISLNKNLSEELITDLDDAKINWDNYFSTHKLSEDFIRKFKDKVSWTTIINTQDLSEDFLMEFKDEIKWHDIITEVYKNLPKNIIENIKNNIKWDDIFYYTLTEWDEIKKCMPSKHEDFIRKFQDMPFNWKYIFILGSYSGFNLSSKFIKEFHSKVGWAFIIPRYKLRANFIREFKNEFTYSDLKLLHRYQKMSSDLKYELHKTIKPPAPENPYAPRPAKRAEDTNA